jgi:O-methyltransferase
MGILKSIFSVLGYNITSNKVIDSTIDLEQNQEFVEIFNKCSPYTMTSKERMYALFEAVKYIETNNVEGDIVECGVWKGGSSMVAALSLSKNSNRKLYLYDTYEGMNEPSEADKNVIGEDAKNTWDNRDKCESSLDEVKGNLSLTNYDTDKINYIVGKVEDTIPSNLPHKISILRLDTDWYESTKHELIHLFPLLQPDGVLIIDDYGHWVGARKAVDEYISENNIKILLNRIDYTGRIGIK